MSPEDIWSEPIVDIGIINAEPEDDNITRPTKRRSLFLSDSEDEDASTGRRLSSRQASPQRGGSVPPASTAEGLDAIFAGVDDDDDDPFAVKPALDIEKMKRQADARLSATTAPKIIVPSLTPYAVGENNSPEHDQDEKSKKERRVMPKLDEERLLGHDGFPRLIEKYKHFKVTGKGHEAADLDKLFQLYHGWTHKLYPKFQFKDTVDRVEKLCRSRRMGVNLRAWRDEAKGIKSDVRHEVTLDDDEGERGDEGSGSDNEQPRANASSPSSSRPSTPLTRPGSAASTAPSVPSSTTDMGDDMDIDIDVLLREEEDLLQALGTGKRGPSYKPSNLEDDDDALWAAAGGIPNDTPEINVPPKTTAPPAGGEADDEDMWGMLDDMSAQPAVREPRKRTGVNDRISQPHDDTAAITNGPTAPSETSSEQSSIGADWDDMYA